MGFGLSRHKLVEKSEKQVRIADEENATGTYRLHRQISARSMTLRRPAFYAVGRFPTRGGVTKSLPMQLGGDLSIISLFRITENLPL
jgi:hypothetical protein